MDSRAGKFRVGLVAALAVASACLNAVPAAAATYADPNFHDDTIVGGLTIPTTAAWAPDGRMFIAEKSGVLKVLDPGQTSASTILDISNEVNDAYDRGLLGLAVDTSYETNHYVYLLYTAEKHPLMADTDAPTFSRLERIQVSGSNEVSDRTTLLGSDGLVDGQAGTDCVTENFVTTWPSANDLDCIPSEGRSHSIGTVVSAPDGTLYVGSGDASSYAEFDQLAFRVYDQHSFAGKILHIDRNGNGLSGHPFCPSDTDLTHVCTKIHSLAFRNPFRFKWRDDGTPDGALTVGDVGWNTHEEVDLIGTAGHAYGWPCYEGSVRTATYQDDPKCDAEYAKEGTPDAHVPPDYDYVHTLTNAIIGGPVYPGGPYPDSYDGQMFFGDYSDSFLKVLNLDSGGAVTGTTNFSGDWMGVDLVLAPDGNIAYPDFGTGEPGTGSIKEIVYAPSAGVPHAAASATPIAGGKPLSVDFSAAESSDPESQALTYTWDFGDTQSGTGVAPNHIYQNSGTYHAVVTVEDPDGHTDSAGVDVQVFDSPPTPVINSPADNSTYRDGQVISLSGSATDAQDGTLPASALSWTVILHHGAHTHFVGTYNGTATPSFIAQRDHDTNSYYEVRLRATDSDAEWRQKTIKLLPEGVPFQILSSPSGAPVSYSGLEKTTPFSTSSAIGLRTSVSAAARFTQNGKNWFFDSWADGGNRLRQIEIPDHASSVTARYFEDKALGGTAKASSVQNDDIAGFGQGLATDDDPGTRWASKGQGADPSPWWEVDLGSSRSVSAVEIDWETAYASKYDILTSADDVHWSLAASESIGGPIRQRTRFQVRKARYVRVQVRQHGSAFGASFFEARVLGPPDADPVPEDKAAGRPASASTTQASPFDPSKAVDDDSATRWSSVSADGQWWRVDLGSPRTVDTVELNWETAYASKYQIQTSLDGTSFTTASTVDITAPGLVRSTFGARNARYVRILSVQRATSFGISFWDARVYGPPDDLTPPDTQITAGPSGSTTSTSATFQFGSEPGATFECSLDGAPFAGCASPVSYDGLAVGGHSFAVQARDQVGNLDPTPATASWTIEAGGGPPGRRYDDVITGINGLLGFWPLGDSNGSAADLKAGHKGRYVGGPAAAGALIQTGSDGAHRFDGRNDRVKLPAGAVGKPRAVTVELWLERAARGGGKRALLLTDARTPLADGFTLFLDARHRPVFALGGTRGRHGSLAGPVLQSGRVYHLVVSYAGKSLTLYVNGARRGSRRYTGGIAYKGGRSFMFGGPAAGRTGGLGAFAGVLDELAVYGNALSAAAVKDHFGLGTGAG